MRGVDLLQCPGQKVVGLLLSLNIESSYLEHTLQVLVLSHVYALWIYTYTISGYWLPLLSIRS
jgi:hypothetical protein